MTGEPVSSSMAWHRRLAGLLRCKTVRAGTRTTVLAGAVSMETRDG
jgi:hypothetical protein